MKATDKGFCSACGVTGRVVIVGVSVGQLCAACVKEAADALSLYSAAKQDRDRAIGLLNRWLSQHSAGGATDPCCVSAELVSESWKAVRT